MTSRQAFRKSQARINTKRESNESPGAAICLQIVDACLIGIIFVAPLFLGGRNAVGRFVFIAMACLAGVAWFTHQALRNRARWTPTWAYSIGLIALLLVSMQLLPLPSSWIDQLATRHSSILSLWTADADESVRLGVWPTLSYAPNSTKIALATLVAYVLLFFTAVGRLRSLSDIERLLRMIALSAIIMGSFGLLQYFTSNGLFFWFYEHPFTTTDYAAKGSFSCQNHFANFLVLGIGPLLAWIVFRLQEQNQKRNRQSSIRKIFDALLYLGLLLIVFAILLSLSRGGAAALAVACTLTITVYYRRRIITGTYLYCLATLGILVVGMLSVYGYDNVSQRLDDFTAGSLDQLDSSNGRRRIWTANLAAIEQGGLFGAGAGTHREIYPIYLPESLNIEYTHAENGYLQIATECGYLGVSLLALSLVAVGLWCWKAIRQSLSVRQLVAAVAVSSGLAASIVHSVVDFVWFIPACMSLTILLASCALRLAQLTASEEVQSMIRVPWPRIRWVGLAVGASLASVWAASIAIGPARASNHWDSYLLASKDQSKESTKRLFALRQIPEDETQQLLTETAIFNLRHALADAPDSARANLRLAGRYLQLFDIRQRNSDNAMSIDQIRDAAMSSHFASAGALQQWLQQAFGKNSELLYHAHYHTLKALQLCPLQGQGYLYLANLCFLNGHNTETIDAYVDQGLKVRPHDGQVLFEVGRQQLLLGRGDKTLNYWRQIFLDRGNHQLKIVKLLAGRIPASDFIEVFQPDWYTLPYVWRWYHHAGSPEDWQNIVQYTEHYAESECADFPARQAALVWRSLANMQRTLNEHDRAIVSFERALKVAPSNYLVRRDYGQALLKAGNYTHAESHLRWCLSREPDDVNLRAELLQATKGSIAQAANTRATSR